MCGLKCISALFLLVELLISVHSSPNQQPTGPDNAVGQGNDPAIDQIQGECPDHEVAS